MRQLKSVELRGPKNLVSSLQHHKLCKEKGLKKEQVICSLESIEIGVERKANETLIGKRGKKKERVSSRTHTTTRGQGKGENPDNITTDRHLFRAM